MQHAGKKAIRKKSVVRYTFSERGSGASRKHEIDKQQSVCSLDESKMEEKLSHAKDQNASTTEIKSLEGHDKGNKQVSIKHFFTKKGKDSNKFHLLPQKATSEATHCETTFSMHNQICKANTLWAMKTAKEDFPFQVYLNCSRECSRLCCSLENDQDSHQGILCD